MLKSGTHRNTSKNKSKSSEGVKKTITINKKRIKNVPEDKIIQTLENKNIHSFKIVFENYLNRIDNADVSMKTTEACSNEFSDNKKRSSKQTSDKDLRKMCVTRILSDSSSLDELCVETEQMLQNDSSGISLSFPVTKRAAPTEVPNVQLLNQDPILRHKNNDPDDMPVLQVKDPIPRNINISDMTRKVVSNGKEIVNCNGKCFFFDYFLLIICICSMLN